MTQYPVKWKLKDDYYWLGHEYPLRSAVRLLGKQIKLSSS